MRKIYITLFVLLIAMVAMVYVYFSNLATHHTGNEESLQVATANSGMVFCMRNDRDILNILGGQDHFQRLIGEKKSRELSALKNRLLSKTSISASLNGNPIYICFLPAEKKDFDYLLTTELGRKGDKEILLQTLKENQIKTAAAGQILQVILDDSTHYYMAVKGKLLLLSNTAKAVNSAMTAAKNQQGENFAAYIKTGDKFNKNSLANLYVDYNRFPELIKMISPHRLSGELSIFSQQNSFAALNYNFSRERIFFNGSAKINDQHNYLQLFTSLSPQKNIIDNILPDNTANFSLYSIPDYKGWKIALDNWFALNKKKTAVRKVLAATLQKYHLNLDQVFPKYFKNQMITFQLQSAEKLGAIQLTNGDKLDQLLLDISESHSEDINTLKEADLLYCYFGEPFKKFRRPYYTIIDNYMIVANHAATLQAFLKDYKENKLLINTADYSSLYNQIADKGNVTFYANNQHSSHLIRHNLYNNYFRYFSTEEGFGHFSSIIYQLSGDKGIFQSNLLINTLPVKAADAPALHQEPE